MIHITKVTATIKVNAMLNSGIKNKTELAYLLGITRPTFDTRLKKQSWKKGELEIIKAM